MANSKLTRAQEFHPWPYVLGVFIVGGLAASLAVLNWELGVVVAACLGLMLLFAWKPIIGLYLMAALYPLINLEFVWGSLNVPYVDVVALFAFAGWLVRSIWMWVVHKQKMTWQQFPGLIFFLAFVAVSFLSILNAEDKLLSFKYVLRPLSFFYFMFVVFPLNTITKVPILIRVFWIFYGIGVLTAVAGVWGFITYPANSIFNKRAGAPELFGVYPFGTSHNLIAEVLVSVIPIGLLLIWLTKKELTRKLLFVGVVGMVLVNLLTFSRTGWLVLLIEFLIFGVVLYRTRVKELSKGLFLLGLLLIPIFVYMFVFSSQSVVQSSDENRQLLNQIAYQTWRDFPIIGAGAGRFQEFVSKNSVYLFEYGATSEAHGFIQKIAAEEGTLGVLTYGALLIFVISRVWKTYRARQSNEFWNFTLLACWAMTLGSIVFQLFQTNYFVAKLWFPLGLALAASHLALKLPQTKHEEVTA